MSGSTKIVCLARLTSLSKRLLISHSTLRTTIKYVRVATNTGNYGEFKKTLLKQCNSSLKFHSNLTTQITHGLTTIEWLRQRMKVSSKSLRIMRLSRSATLLTVMMSLLRLSLDLTVKGSLSPVIKVMLLYGSAQKKTIRHQESKSLISYGVGVLLL